MQPGVMVLHLLFVYDLVGLMHESIKGIPNRKCTPIAPKAGVTR